MVRVEDLNITFFHVAKNAGTSIATWLTSHVGGDEYMDDLRHARPEALKPLFEDFGWTFCCVRNTWDRYVSWYNFFKGQSKIDMSFEDYLNAVIANNHSAKYIAPMGSQLPFVDSVDYVIRYENLVDDFNIVQQKTGCYKPLPKTNSSNRTSYTDYYKSKHHIAWVAEKHSEEIARLNYVYGE
jgi:hypothetical protein